jgi:hypothetical protein
MDQKNGSVSLSWAALWILVLELVVGASTEAGRIVVVRHWQMDLLRDDRIVND